MKSVIKGAGYILAHTPDMVLHNGTTQTTERIVNPDGVPEGSAQPPAYLGAGSGLLAQPGLHRQQDPPGSGRDSSALV